MTVPINFTPEGRRYVHTEHGQVALIDVGSGFPTVFLHGLGQSSYFWRAQLEAFCETRRCLAFDLMAHGFTEALAGADVSFREQAKMILGALDSIGIQGFDMVLNDSGGAIGQIIAVMAPNRIRSMAFSNCDVHDNWPPKTLNEMRTAAKEGVFADQIGEYINDPESFKQTVGKLIYRDPNFVTEEALRINIEPLVSSQERKDAYNRYVGFQDHSQLVVIENEIRQLQIPALIVWGTADPFFPVHWAYWLHDALPLAEPVIELNGEMLFFPEEKPEAFNEPLISFWSKL